MKKNYNQRFAFDPLSILLMMVLFLLIAIFYFVSTPAGTRTLAYTVSALHEKLEIKGVSGTLLTDLTIEKIRFDDGASVIELDNVFLDPKAQFYKEGTIYAKKLDIERLSILLEPSKSTTSEDYVPDIAVPFELELDTFDIGELLINEKQGADSPKTLFAIEDLNLVQGSIKDGWLKGKHLGGVPLIAGEEMPLEITDPVFEFANPHRLSGHVTAAYQHPEVGELTANLDLGGQLTQYELSGDLFWEKPDLIEGKNTIAVKSVGTFGEMDFEQLDIETAEGDLSLNGELSWRNNLAWDVDVQGAGVKTHKFLPEWPAQLDLKGQSKGQLVDGKPELSVFIEQAEGSVKDFPVTAKGKISFIDGVINTEHFEAVSEASHVKVNGTLSEPLDLTWDIDADDVSKFMPDIEGEIKGKGEFKGDFNNLIGNGNLSIKGLSYQDISIGSASVKFVGSPDGDNVKGQGKVSLKGFQYQDIEIAESQFDLDMVRADGRLIAQGKGVVNRVQYQDLAIKKSILDLDITEQNGRIVAKAKGDIGNTTWQDLAIKRSQLDIDFSGDNNQFTAKAKGNITQTGWQDLDIKQSSIDIDIVGKNDTISAKGKGVFSGATYQDAGIGTADLVFNGTKIGDQMRGDVKGKLTGINYQNAESGNSDIQISAVMNNGELDVKGNTTVNDFKYPEARIKQAQLDFSGKQRNGLWSGDVTGKLRDVRYQDFETSEANIVAKGSHGNGSAEGNIDIKLRDTIAKDLQIDRSTIALQGKIKDGRGKGTAKSRLTNIRYQDVKLKDADIVAEGTINQGKLDGTANAILGQLDYQDLHVVKSEFKADGTFHNGRAKGKVTGELSQLLYQDLKVAKTTLTANGVFKNGQGSAKVKGRFKQAIYKGDTLALSDIDGDISFADGKIKSQLNTQLGPLNYQGLQVASSSLSTSTQVKDGKTQSVVKGTLRNIQYQDAKIAQADVDLTGNFNNGRGIGGGKAILTQVEYQGAVVKRAELKGDGSFIKGNATGKVDAVLDQVSYDGATVQRATINADGSYSNGAAEGKARGMLTQVRYQDVQIGSIHFDGTGKHDKNISKVNGKAVVSAIKKGEQQVKTARLTFEAIQAGEKLDAKGDFDVSGVKSGNIQLANSQGNFVAGRHNGKVFGKGNVKLGVVKSPDFNWKNATLEFDANKQTLRIKGRTAGLVVAGQPVKDALFDVDGTPEKHHFVMNAEHHDGKLSVRGQGRIINQGWTGTVQELSLKDTVTGDWTLKKPVNLSVSDGNFEGSEICLGNAKRGSACAVVNVSKAEGVHIEGKLITVPLAQFNNFLPDAIELPGQVNGQFDLRQKAGKNDGVVTLLLPDSHILLKVSDKKTEKLRYTNGRVVAKMKGDVIETTTSLDLVGRGQLTAITRIMLSVKDGKHRVEGKVNFDVNDLKWAQAYVPDVTGLNGKLKARVTISGLVAKPSISGEVDLTQASFSIPDTGTRFTDINFKIKSASMERAVITGTLRTGGSVLTAEGNISLAKLPDWKGHLTLKGKEVQMMDTHEAQVWVTPDLTFDFTPKSVKVGGTLTIPKAIILLEEIPELAIHESEDVVFVGEREKKEVTKEPSEFKVMPNVRVVMGENIQFSGFGLNALLKGSFKITHNQGNILAQGSVNLQDGVYKSYGQQLKIDSGILVFNGPFSNPGVNIRATREIESQDLVVGIQLGGTLQVPKSNIFSEPALSESDALSYLLTGHSLGSTTGGEAQLLVHAVRSLGISGSNSLLAKIGNTVGLDDVNIITHDDYKKNQLALGKRLGPKLYIRYITGIFDSFHKVAVNYQINKRLKLEAVSGEAQSVDFIYEMERD